MDISVRIYGRCEECGMKKEFEICSENLCCVRIIVDSFKGNVMLDAKGKGEGYCTTCNEFKKFDIENFEIVFGGGVE